MSYLCALLLLAAMLPAPWGALPYCCPCGPRPPPRHIPFVGCRGMCTWRAFNTGNHSETFAWTYGLEVLFHEMLLQSEHRCGGPRATSA